MSVPNTEGLFLSPLVTLPHIGHGPVYIQQQGIKVEKIYKLSWLAVKFRTCARSKRHEQLHGDRLIRVTEKFMALFMHLNLSVTWNLNKNKIVNK
jgi:hypothetical protein